MTIRNPVAFAKARRRRPKHSTLAKPATPQFLHHAAQVGRSKYTPAGSSRDCGTNERPVARGPKGRRLNVLNPKDMAILAKAARQANTRRLIAVDTTA